MQLIIVCIVINHHLFRRYSSLVFLFYIFALVHLFICIYVYLNYYM